MTGCYVPCHACIDNCIHTYAGVQLRLDCARLMEAQGREEPTGRARLTRAYNLPCDYVLHTVGPIIQDRVRAEDRRLLAGCYRSCLELAEAHGGGEHCLLLHLHRGVPLPQPGGGRDRRGHGAALSGGA